MEIIISILFSPQNSEYQYKYTKSNIYFSSDGNLRNLSYVCYNNKVQKWNPSWGIKGDDSLKSTGCFALYPQVMQSV